MANTPSVVGQKELIARMRSISRSMPEDIAGIDVQHLLLRRVLTRFEDSQAPDGVSWPPLEEETVRRKKRQGYARPEKALEASGRLRKAIRIISGSSAGLLLGNTGLGFRIGVSDPVAAAYGALHNKGLGAQPQRRFIGVGAGDVVAVRAFVARRVKKTVEGT